MLLCCMHVVVGVVQAFYEYGIQLNLVLRFGENDWFGWRRYLRCLSTRLDPALGILVMFLVLLGKYLSNTRVTFDF